MTFREKIRTASDLLTEASTLIDRAFEMLDLSTEERDQYGAIRRILVSHAQAHIGPVHDACTSARDMLNDVEESIWQIEDEAERRAEVLADSGDY